MTTPAVIQITREGRFDGFYARLGMYFRAVADRRDDGTPVCYTLREGVVIPATHAIELIVDDRRRRVVGRAPVLAKKAIVDNMLEWAVRS